MAWVQGNAGTRVMVGETEFKIIPYSQPNRYAVVPTSNLWGPNMVELKRSASAALEKVTDCKTDGIEIVPGALTLMYDAMTDCGP
ncbi:hypothetical protein ACSHT0_04010 [Tepidicaulis sp. LMO-SS28]|uniref:hypothetical protein n=1 Tax=Tepidicaulis sp. LMO-SS28 TaxID=3447455 RepID=UPI003EE2F05C